MWHDVVKQLGWEKQGKCKQNKKTTEKRATVSSVQSCPTLCNPWTRLPCPSPTPGACSMSCPKSVMPSNHLILCHPLLLLPSIFPSIKVFSSESVLCIKWPKLMFSFNISPSTEYSGLTFFRTDWFVSLQFKGLSSVFSNTTV